MTDPFAVLGVPRSATVAEIRAARKRLALQHHPDRGGDAERMRAINAAVDAAVAHATGRRPLSAPADGPVGEPSRPPMPTERGGVRRRRTTPWNTTSGRSAPGRFDRDVPSFVVEALPVEAFEALLLAAAALGDLLDDDPPYRLDVLLSDPLPCWCRLELLPDAGSSTVSLTVAAIESGTSCPMAEAVRDLWIAEINSLGEAPLPS